MSEESIIRVPDDGQSDNVFLGTRSMQALAEFERITRDNQDRDYGPDRNEVARI